MPVFIFRGKVVVLGEDKERQKPDRGTLHLEHPRHSPQRMKQLHAGTIRQVEITADHQRRFFLDGGPRFFQRTSRFYRVASVL